MFTGLITILFCAILNPYAGPPGTLAPLIPIIPMMISSGVHPLPLSILVGLIGLVVSAFRFFSKVVEINGKGTKSGIILLFGFLGISSSLDSLRNWADKSKSPEVFVPLIEVGLNTIKSAASARVAAVCIIAGIAVNPALGWIVAVFIENFEIIKDSASDRILTVRDCYITAVLVVVTGITLLLAYMI
ncbi:MAG: DUF3360 family protein [Mobilitalea sp.]